MIEAGLIATRFLHYSAVLALFGMSLFAVYAYPCSEPVTVLRWRRRALIFASLLALISGLIWFACVVASLSGDIGGIADGEVVWSVVSDTNFGKLWVLRTTLMLLLVALTLLTLAFDKLSTDVSGALLAGLLLASLAGQGHTQLGEGLAHAIHVSADAAHLLAAGAWLGGLLPLGVLLLVSRRENDDQVDGVLKRFSGMGYIAVATLVGSGLLNTWFLVGSAANAFTPYGIALVSKVILFGGMLCLAIANRFWLLPAIDKNKTSVSLHKRLRRHVLAEQCLGFAIVLIVSVLGTLQPAVN